MDKKIFIKIYGSIVSAVAFACFLWYAFLFFNLSVQTNKLLVGFLIGFTGYSSLRLSKHKITKYLFIAASIVLIYLLYIAFPINTSRILILLLNGFIWIFYHSFFRWKILLKPLIIASSWISWSYFYTQYFNVWFYIQQFLLIFLLTLPFDVNGMKRDKIPTIPKKYGIKNTVQVIRILLLFYFLTGLILPYEYCINTIIIFILINVFLFYRKTFEVFYVYLYYDGIIAMQTLVLLLVKTFFHH